MKRCGVALVVAAVAGCSGDQRAQETPLAQRAQSIEGAAPDPVTRSAAALCEGDLPQTCTLRCSGILIAPNVVVTARHCVTSHGSARIDCEHDAAGSVRLAPERTWVTTSTRLERASFVRGQSWSLPASVAACGHDLALLTLADPIEDSAGIAIATPTFGPAPRERLTLVGYGAAGGADPSSGTRRTRSDAATVCTGRDGWCSRFGTALAPTEFLVDVGACAGDSGGGALLGTAPDVAGVISRTVGASDDCGIAVLSSFDQHALMFARAVRTAAARSSYEIPSWVAQAETRGNASSLPARAFGAPCDEDSDCATNACRSKDGGRQWSCSAPCAAGCPQGSRCDSASNACFAAETRPDPGGCSASAASPASAKAIWAAVALVGCLVRRRRMRRGL